MRAHGVAWGYPAAVRPQLLVMISIGTLMVLVFGLPLLIELAVVAARPDSVVIGWSPFAAAAGVSNYSNPVEWLSRLVLLVLTIGSVIAVTRFVRPYSNAQSLDGWTCLGCGYAMSESPDGTPCPECGCVYDRGLATRIWNVRR